VTAADEKLTTVRWALSKEIFGTNYYSTNVSGPDSLDLHNCYVACV
jgi:hypothetical protein